MQSSSFSPHSMSRGELQDHYRHSMRSYSQQEGQAVSKELKKGGLKGQVGARAAASSSGKGFLAGPARLIYHSLRLGFSSAKEKVVGTPKAAQLVLERKVKTGRALKLMGEDVVKGAVIGATKYVQLPVIAPQTVSFIGGIGHSKHHEEPSSPVLLIQQATEESYSDQGDSSSSQQLDDIRDPVEPGLDDLEVEEQAQMEEQSPQVQEEVQTAPVMSTARKVYIFGSILLGALIAIGTATLAAYSWSSEDQ